MADWVIGLISALSGLIGGGGIIALILIPQTRRKENLNNDSLAISALKDTLNEVRAENTRKDGIIDKIAQERDNARQRYEDKCEESASAKAMLCVHMGCSLRDPALGRGDNWFHEHGDDPTLGADFLPVNQLMKKYGKKKREEELREECNGED